MNLFVYLGYSIFNFRSKFFFVVASYFLLYAETASAQQVVVPKLNINNHFVFVDENNKQRFDLKEWEEAVSSDDHIYLCSATNTYNFINQHGLMLNDSGFSSARNFSHGKAAVYKNDHWGFINIDGSFVVPCEYDFVIDFTDSVTFVRKADSWFLINENGLVNKEFKGLQFATMFKDGVSQIKKSYQCATVNTSGDILNPGWVADSVNFPKSAIKRNSPESNDFTYCPSNLDFENCDFTNWTCYVGNVRSGLTLTQSPPTPGQHQVFQQGSGFDTYGGFPLSPPDGSSCAIRLGNPIPGAGAESVEYNFTIPPNVNDYTFLYQYALVFQDPGHPVSAQPRFRVELYDITSGQVVYCASVDYTAGYGGASYFSQSQVNPLVYYKSWTPVFINLGRYFGHQLKLTLTTMDCAYGGHWCYAYIDINTCGYSGLSAHNSCVSPYTTTLDAPGGFSSYVWSTSPTLANPLGNTQHVVVPAPGLLMSTPVFVQVIPENGVGCSDTLSTNVTPYVIKASFPPAIPQCLRANSFAFQSYSQTNGGAISQCLWNFHDGTNTEVGETVTHQFPYADTFQVTLTASNADGCLDDTTLDVIVIPSPILRVSGTEICSGSSALITLSGGDTYDWNPRNGLVFTSLVSDSAYSGIDNNNHYTVTITDTTTHCSMDSVIYVINYPNPTADFQQPSPQCLRGNNFSFINNSSITAGGNIVGYLWTFGDDSTSTDFSTSHAYDTAGIYTVNLYTVSADGCRDTTTKQIVVNAHPSSNIISSGSLRFCYKDSVILTALSQAGSGVISSYQWFNNNESINGSNQSSITIDTTGLYQLVIENSNGCKDTSLAQPVIAHPLPTGNLTTDPSNTGFICDGSSVKIQVNQSTATTYQWYYADLQHPSAFHPVSGADSASIQASLPGYYSLEMTTSTIPACKGFATDTINLSLIKKPIPDFTYPNYCAGTPINFHNTSNISQSGPSNWVWNFGDISPNSYVINPIHNYDTGTNYPVTLTVIPTYCPNLDSSRTIYVNVEEPVRAIRYPTINAVQLTNTPLHARDFAVDYSWSPAIGFLNNSYHIQNPIFNYDQETDYTVRMETSAGCITVDTQLVRIFYAPDIKVPTAFTPNADGHNDKLDVFLIGLIKFNFFRIFNRWGQLIYETNDINKKWDGTFKGVKQPAETYVWIAEGIDQKNNVVNRRGQFILMR